MQQLDPMRLGLVATARTMESRVVVLVLGALSACTPVDGVAGAKVQSCCECLASASTDGGCLGEGAECVRDARQGQVVEVEAPECITAECLSECIPAYRKGMRVQAGPFSAGGGDGHAYLQMTGEDYVTFDEASDACDSIGAHLATLSSASEETIIGDLPVYVGGWIGLTDRDTEGVFEWVDDTPFEFEDWTGEPNDDSRDCVRVAPELGGWGAADCESASENEGEWAFVCEID